MSGRQRQIYKGLSKRAETQRKGAICQERKVICPCAKRLSLSSSLIGWPTGRFTSTRSSLRGSGWKQRDAIIPTRSTTTKKEKKNFAFIRPLAWLLKGQNKMTDKEELIKALAIAIACLKSKTFDDGIIGDLEEVLKKNMEKDNEKIENG